MCGFIGNCLDIKKLTDEEVACLEEWLQERKDNLEQQVKIFKERLEDSQKRIKNVDKAMKRIAPRRKRK